MSLAIETQSLSKSYGSIQALKELNLKVPVNSIFGLLGPNGSGKTTSMKLLLDLIKPTAGSARDKIRTTARAFRDVESNNQLKRRERR